MNVLESSERSLEQMDVNSCHPAEPRNHLTRLRVKCPAKDSVSWSCSGILIGPRHVLTSAHCINGVEVATLEAGFLERNGRLQWYNVAKAYIPLRWKVDGDYAVLKLKGLPSRRSHVSVAPMALPKNSKISITGFPGDKDPESLWISKCRALLVTSGLIWNDCDVKRGSSGSGVLAKDNSSGSPRTVVVGVLSGIDL
ncbi:Protease, serine, 35 [Desmophyllum pertusum]|uniref:Serine protease n=1 Tax=Desmophyllum pertusum TaxID=174260 RepID=A0A9W9ZHR9_9CNID|nr:Protease, serine, 35 [Desmophyllum pertusum]